MKKIFLRSIFLLVFSFFFFNACESDDTSNDPIQNNSTITILSTTPVNGGNISQGDTITAQLNYTIDSMDSSKKYIAVIWIKKTQGYGSYGFGIEELTSSNGTVSHSYVLDNEFDLSEYDKPFKIKYSINAYDENLSVSEIDWDATLVALSGEITLYNQ